MNIFTLITNTNKKIFTSYKGVWLCTAVVSFFLILYAGVFIYKSSIVVEGQRYFCLFDDAMISMRYAYNFANGNGLVWNIGEPIEGYTNFLWTLIMSGVHCLGFTKSQACLAVQVIGIAILIACLAVTVRLSQECKLPPIAGFCAILLVATQYNLVFFTLLGMETGFVTLFASLGLYKCLQSVNRQQQRLSTLLWFVPAILARPDTILIYGLCFLYLYYYIRKDRKILIGGFCIVASLVLCHFLWRYFYYGNWFPNTYYLKATNWPLVERLQLGLKNSLFTVLPLGLPFLFAVFATKVHIRLRIVIIAGFTLMFVYQIYIGGDAWPMSRFVLPCAIGLLVISASTIYTIAESQKKYSLLTGIALAALTIVSVNSTFLDQALLLADPLQTDGNRENIRYWKAVEKVASKESSVAVYWAGTFPYYSDLRCVDLLGKSDPHIARLKAGTFLRAGHNKSDLYYSLFEKKPDIILRILSVAKSCLYSDFWDDIIENYQPAVVPIDGKDVVFAYRKESSALFSKELKTRLWESAFEIVKTPGHSTYPK